MSDAPEDDERARPLTRREARDAVTPARGIPLGDPPLPESDADADADAAAAAVPGLPDLPTPSVEPLSAARASTGSAGSGSREGADRDPWRAARDDFESHVAHAREQFDQANERIKQRTGRNLILAIVIGLGIGLLLLASLIFIKSLFVPIALAGGLLATYELSRALRTSGYRVDVVPQLIAGGLLILAGYFADIWLSWVALFAAVAFVVVWRLIAQMILKDGRTYGDVLADAAVSGFVQIYVPFLASVALILLSREGGQWWVLAFIVIAVSADTGAYASGLTFGKHPMAPKISPKKTWEGFAGAAVASIIAGVLLALFLLELDWWAGVIFGVAILLSATLGDLGESMLKRDLGIKDMSSWLPGHGGILDRLDSILPSTIPALCLYYLLSPWAVM